MGSWKIDYIRVEDEHKEKRHRKETKKKMKRKKEKEVRDRSAIKINNFELSSSAIGIKDAIPSRPKLQRLEGIMLFIIKIRIRTVCTKSVVHFYSVWLYKNGPDLFLFLFRSLSYKYFIHTKALNMSKAHRCITEWGE